MTASIRLRSGHVKDGPPPSEAVYRAAAKRDLTALARLHAEHLRYHAAFDERYAAGVDTDLVGPYRDHLHDPLTRVYVVEVAGALRGFALCRLHEPPTPRPGRRTARSTEATIVDFYIAAEHRRQGLGRRLYVYATDRLGEAGVREVNLGVLVANDAGLVFWRSMGFEPYRLQLRRQLDPPLGRDRGLAGQ